MYINHWKKLTNDARRFWLQEAYRKWVCSSLVPYFAHRILKDGETLGGSGIKAGPRLRPCRSFCQTVEQRCPYFLPGDRAPAYPTQYAGEPTFLCRGKKKRNKRRKEKNEGANQKERNNSSRSIRSIQSFSRSSHLEEGYKCSVGTLLASQVCEE